MSFFVKRLVFYGFLSVFISFYFSNCFDPPENIDKPSYTNVEYSEDGKSLTIYLDGSAPVPANRALSQKLAILGHNFFEVTFLYKSNTQNIIARAEWELGEPAGVSGVYRTASPGTVYYDGTKTNPVNVNLLDPDTGLAVLFVGRKSDKTLLAVGTLSKIDETNINPSGENRITSSTKKVTFAVNAFEAGVDKVSSESSFQIQGTNQGTLKEIDFSGQSFPYFSLDKPHTGTPTTYTATYTVGVHSKTEPYDSFSFYAPAIILRAAATCDDIDPHYTLPSFGPQHSKYDYGKFKALSITSPTAVGSPFSGTVNFSITTSGENKKICALIFEIPVCAVSTSGDSSGTLPVNWWIRPGYNEYYRELDSGNSEKENGGAVLIVVGDIEGVTSGLSIVGDPIKYNKIGYTSDHSVLYFTLKGFEIWFTNSSGDPVSLTPADQSPPYPNISGWSANLTFFYNDGTTPYPGAPLTPTTELPNGEVLIRVRYITGGGSIYYTEFVVEVNYSITEVIDIPYQNRIFVSKPNDYTEIGNRIRSPGNYLVVFAENINLPTATLNSITSPLGVYIYMVAVAPNLTIGRAAGTQTTIASGSTGPITIYFGKWPFNEPAFVGGDVVTNYPFKISSRGTWEQYGNVPTAGTPMFRNNGSGTLSIPSLAGATVDYPDSLPVSP